MKKIKLTQGKFAFVDDEDYQELSRHRWCSQVGQSTFYAVRRFWLKYEKKYEGELMHRRILGLKHADGKKVDHINGNGLDNRKQNLRICSQAENLCNSKVRRDNTSGYKGVSWHRNRRKWQAHIGVDGKLVYLGIFPDSRQAAAAYNRAALAYHGQFARLNS